MSNTYLSLLITSRVKLKLVAYFSQNTHNKIHVRQLSREIGEDISGMTRFMREIEKAGLVIRTQMGNQVYYQTNIDCPVLAEIRRIARMKVDEHATLKAS